MAAKNFFTADQQQAIRLKIATAEKSTSGEVRVHIDERCKGDALDRAADHFKRMEMHRTAQRNGVLFYLAVADRKFAIIGDKGINEEVPEGFWDSIRDVMSRHVQKKEFTEGLCLGIEMAGEKLKAHFPYEEGDVNELSDDVSFGK